VLFCAKGKLTQLSFFPNRHALQQNHAWEGHEFTRAALSCGGDGFSRWGVLLKSTRSLSPHGTFLAARLEVVPFPGGDVGTLKKSRLFDIAVTTATRERLLF
jgi:hypothetical protein